MYRRILRRGGLLLLAVLIGLGGLGPVAHAADNANPEGGLDLNVSPTSIALEVKPDAGVSTDLKIKNNELSTEHLKVSLLKFGAEGETGTPKLEDLSPGDDFAKWASFSQTHFDAQPNVWTTIKMTINPPKTAAFGYYYAVIFSRDTSAAQPKAANLLGAVASLVLLDVQAPGAKRQAQVVQFSTPKKVSEFLPVNFTVRMHNTGNVHVAPRGNIFVTKGGKNVALLEVNQTGGYILPDTFRQFTAAWSNGTPVYKVKMANGKAVLDKNDKQQTYLDWSNFNPSKLRFGKYTAHLVMVYNDGNRDVPVEAYLSFWIMPWRILIIGFLILLLVLAGLYAVAFRPLWKRFKQKRQPKRVN